MTPVTRPKLGELRFIFGSPRLVWFRTFVNEPSILNLIRSVMEKALLIPVKAASKESLPAVTISIAKRKGTNAVEVANNVLRRIEPLKGVVIPSDVTVDITRQYGETAAEKSNELLLHMLIAVISVSLL